MTEQPSLEVDQGEPQRCPTCQARVWSVKLGMWVNQRETVGMICLTCGRDYSEGSE